ncbi:hypothetical protein [Lacrimispora sp.]|uniref:hypothetical protein n=1 Tax=Lacrimispora sp. TaxID=2719234 RepID=UPI0028AD8B13|nr:hypothetical protein [Lacrimispora sp.]
MSYSEYPHSKFPETICDLPNMQDASATLRPVIEQYNEAWMNNDTDKMAALTKQYPILTKSLFNADKFNVLLDGVKATQKFFKEEVDEMILTVAQKTVGINDSAESEDKKRNAYSAEKTDYLTGVTIATDIEIPVGAWDENLTYTYSSDKILENDRVNVFFNSDSMFHASKAFIVVKENTGAGNFVLKANKLPKSALTIREIEVMRKDG